MSLNELFAALRSVVAERHPDLVVPAPLYEGFRPGDIRHSQADIGKARRLLGYDPTYDVGSGLREALPWYEARLRRPAAGPPPVRHLAVVHPDLPVPGYSQRRRSE